MVVRMECVSVTRLADGFETVGFRNPELLDGQVGESYETQPEQFFRLVPGHGYEPGKHYDFPVPTVAVEDYPPEEPGEE